MFGIQDVFIYKRYVPPIRLLSQEVILSQKTKSYKRHLRTVPTARLECRKKSSRNSPCVRKNSKCFSKKHVRKRKPKCVAISVKRTVRKGRSSGSKRYESVQKNSIRNALSKSVKSSQMTSKNSSKTARKRVLKGLSSPNSHKKISGKVSSGLVSPINPIGLIDLTSQPSQDTSHNRLSSLRKKVKSSLSIKNIRAIISKN